MYEGHVFSHGKTDSGYIHWLRNIIEYTNVHANDPFAMNRQTKELVEIYRRL